MLRGYSEGLEDMATSYITSRDGLPTVTQGGDDIESCDKRKRCGMQSNRLLCIHPFRTELDNGLPADPNGSKSP
ncbi:hypothetical protein ACOSQ3_007188 [Xanthoceras sorbifolium]